MTKFVVGLFVLGAIACGPPSPKEPTEEGQAKAKATQPKKKNVPSFSNNVHDVVKKRLDETTLKISYVQYGELNGKKELDVSYALPGFIKDIDEDVLTVYTMIWQTLYKNKLLGEVDVVIVIATNFNVFYAATATGKSLGQFGGGEITAKEFKNSWKVER